jgi:uncharacterized protein YkwD
MLRALVVFLAMSIAGSEACAAQSSQPATGDNESSNYDHQNQSTPRLTSAATPSSGEDFAAENDLLRRANRNRQSAGAPPLRMDESLCEAARAHARRMIASSSLEHQYSGEPALLQRIALGGPLKVDYAGENLASANGSASADAALMHSPPHRRNLLDREFNVAGIAAVWSQGKLYVVQDFAREIPSYSTRDSVRLVGQAIGETRQEAGVAQLSQVTPPKLQEATCALASDNLPNAHMLSAAYNNRRVITYTQSRPEILPQAALSMLRDPTVKQFAVGACYARSAAYPNGTYWVAILLY